MDKLAQATKHVLGSSQMTRRHVKKDRSQNGSKSVRRAAAACSEGCTDAAASVVWKNKLGVQNESSGA